MENSFQNIKKDAEQILISRPRFHEEVFNIRSGPKYTVTTKESDKELTTCLEKYKKSLDFIKVRKQVNLGQAEWLYERHLAFITKKSKFFQTMGHRTIDGHDCLFAEEALYLVDVGDIELLYKEIPISFQDAFTLILNDSSISHEHTCTLEEYQVFSYIIKLGFVVQRFAFDYMQEKVELGPLKSEFIKEESRLTTKKSKACVFTKKQYHVSKPTTEKKCRGWWIGNNSNNINTQQQDCNAPTYNFDNLVCSMKQCSTFENVANSINACSKENETNDLLYSHSRKLDLRKCKNCSTWLEYKAKLEPFKREANEAFLKNLKEMQNMKIKPLLQPCDARSVNKICLNIKLTEEVNVIPFRQDDNCDFNIKFNIFKSQSTNFKKSSPGIPYARIVVMNLSQSFPQLNVQTHLQNISRNVPILYALVDGDQIAFYDINNIGIAILCDIT